MSCSNILDGNIHAITIGRIESLDIDTVDDLEYASTY